MLRLGPTFAHSPSVDANQRVTAAGVAHANRLPLLLLFSGTLNVNAEADAAGAGGKGKVHIRSIKIDGTEVPRVALEFFINQYLKPKYPNIGIDSEVLLIIFLWTFRRVSRILDLPEGMVADWRRNTAHNRFWSRNPLQRKSGHPFPNPFQPGRSAILPQP